MAWPGAGCPMLIGTSPVKPCRYLLGAVVGDAWSRDRNLRCPGRGLGRREDFLGIVGEWGSWDLLNLIFPEAEGRSSLLSGFVSAFTVRKIRGMTVNRVRYIVIEIEKPTCVEVLSIHGCWNAL